MKLPDYHYDAAKRLKATSNYADYRTHAPYVCCGWMDMHVDEKINKSWGDLWEFKVIACHDNAYFVCKDDDNRYVSHKLKEGGVYKIYYRKPHGVLPKRLADLIVTANRYNVKGYKKWVSKIDNKLCKAKLIFEWTHIDAY